MTETSTRSNVWLVLLLLVYVEAGNQGSFNVASRINEVLKNDSSLQFYAKCFLDKGPCSGDARVIKRLIPEFVSTNCGKCSLRQKQLACKVIFKLQEDKLSDLWKDFLIKYDPEEEYRTNLTSFMESCTKEFEVDD